MIGLTAGLTLLVSALGSTLVMWLPVIILSTLGSAFTFSFFHWVWAKLNRMVGFKTDRNVEVFEIDADKKYGKDNYGDIVIKSRTNYYWSDNDPLIKYRHGDGNVDYYEDWGDVRYKEVYDKKNHQTFSRKLRDDEVIPEGSYVSAVRDVKYKYWKNYKLLD